MQRIGQRARLKPGSEEKYEQVHREVWPVVLETLKKAGVHNYSIFREGLDLFAYFELPDDLEKMESIYNEMGECIQWEQLMAPMMECHEGISFWKNMSVIFYLQ